MKRGGIVLVMLALLAGLTQMGAFSQSDRSGSDTAAKHPAENRINDALSPGARSPSLPEAMGTAYGLAGAIDAFWGSGNIPFEANPRTCADIRFLMAVVPDPVHTHLGLFYDRTIEAIQESAEKNGYDFDRAWIPWDFKAHQESDDFERSDAEAKEARIREGFPGLLIFREGAGKISSRRDPACAQPLFVFLAGEAPTAGLSKRQFENALDIVAWMRAKEHLLAGRIARKLPLLILGPTFSGTLYSLKSEIDEALKRKDLAGKDSLFNAVSVLSGSVTDYESRHWFRDAIHGSPVPVDFAVFQYDDSVELQQFLEYAQRVESGLIHSPRDVVIISEEGTAFGRASTSPAADAPISIYFPREISQFRAAYQKARDAVSSAGGTASGAATRSVLPLDLGTTGSGDDVELAAPLQTPRSQEAVMMGIVSLLNERRPRVIMLRATDPLDEEFLARYLANSYARGRIVVMPPDLLLAREGDGVLQGTLAVAPYVLNTDSHSAFVFPNSLSIGVYDAMSALLRTAEVAWTCEDDKDCANKRKEVERRTEDSDTAMQVPALKLSILGRFGYSCLGSLAAGTHETDESGRTPWTSMFSWDVAYGTCLLIAAFQLLASWKGRVFSRLQSFALFNRLPSRKKTVLIGIGSLLLVEAFLLLLGARTHVPQGLDYSPGGLFITILLWAPAVVLGIGTVLDMVWYRGEQRIAGCYCIMAAMFGFGMYQAGVGEAGCRDSWGTRVLDLASGVSPLMPLLLLLAGGYWWVWHSLQGAFILGERRPKLPNIRRYMAWAKARSGHAYTEADAGRKKLSRPDEEQAERVFEAGTIFGGLRRLILPAGIIALLSLLVLWASNELPPLETVEGRYFDWAYCFIFASLVAAYAFILARIVWVWVECHHILEGLDRTGLRDAFIRIKGFSWDLMWNPPSSAFEQGRRVLSRQVEDLEKLGNLLPKDREVKFLPTCQTEIESSLKQAHDLSDRYAGMIAGSASGRENKEDDRQLIEDFTTLQIQFALTADIIFLDVLRPLWLQDSTPALSTAEKQDKEGSSGNNNVQAWRKFAEEFVALVYVNFLMRAVLQIRTLVMCTIGLFVFLIIAMNAYPFEPKSGLQILTIALFLAAGGATTYVYVEMHRNATLSRLTRDDDGGNLGTAFWRKLLTGGAIPLLGLLASQVPFIGNLISSWLQPALQALK